MAFFVAPLLQTINGSVAYLNGSKLFAGVVMIMLNMCSRFMNVRLSKTSETFIKSHFTKHMLVFAISWMGTRDIYMALILTAVFTILSDLLFNENSKFCVVPEKYKVLSNAMDTNNDGVVSQEEINQALAVLEKAKRDKTKQQQRSSLAMFHSYVSDAPVV